MAEIETTLLNAEPHRLARLMGLAEREASLWSREELGQVMAHQMRAPLRFGIVPEGSRLAAGVAAMKFEDWTPFGSYADVLCHSHPPLELLRLIKDFAKARLDGASPEVPGEVALVVYMASIAAALVRCGERISKLEDAALRRGLTWAIELPWLEERLRVLLREAVSRLGAG